MQQALKALNRHLAAPSVSQHWTDATGNISGMIVSNTRGINTWKHQLVENNVPGLLKAMGGNSKY